MSASPCVFMVDLSIFNLLLFFFLVAVCFIYLFFFAHFFFFKFYFIFKLYIIVLVLPNIKMNLPQVYNLLFFKNSFIEI